MNWANVLINFSPVSQFQRDRGITAFQEQTGGSEGIKEMFGEIYSWGSLCYAYVPKELRGNKLSQRAVACLWVGYDEQTPGAHRVVPFASEEHQWVFFKTQRFMKVKVMEGTFPLKGQAYRNST